MVALSRMTLQHDAMQFVQVADFEATINELKERQVKFAMESMNSPVCVWL